VKKWILLLIFSFVLSGCGEDRTDTETIIFLRHGEQPVGGKGQLNCLGLNRSFALSELLYVNYGIPDAIFAPNPSVQIKENGSSYYNVSPLATIEPTAIQFSLPVNLQYAYDAHEAVANALLAPENHHATIFVSWNQNDAMAIAKAIVIKLGASEKLIPNWSEKDFDSFYVLDINWHSSTPKVIFSKSAQGLNDESIVCPSMEGISLPNVPSAPKNTQIFLFIPTAETAISDSDQLGCKGLNRSVALAKVLSRRFHDVDYFFAPAPDKGASADTKSYHLSSLMTIEPTVVSYRDTLMIPYSQHDIEKFAQLLADPKYHEKVTAIAWPADELLALIRLIYKANKEDIKYLPDVTLDSDTLYQVTFTRKMGKMIPTFTQIPQNLDELDNSCFRSIDFENEIEHE
jgi:hypothetical protein